MPNGDPIKWQDDYPKLEAFFAKIADVLEHFANKHNLTIEKYYHEGHEWSFLFRHPLGGIGKIQVSKSRDENVTVYPIWWVDDYEQKRRRIKHLSGEQSTLDKNILAKILEDTLQTILGWQIKDLDFSSRLFFLKSRRKKEIFSKYEEQHPFPKI